MLSNIQRCRNWIEASLPEEEVLPLQVLKKQQRVLGMLSASVSRDQALQASEP
jgi:hypothetical protein